MKHLVIYHKDCFDGFTAAWVWRRFFGLDSVKFWGARYGGAPPPVDPEVDRVWVLDFSYPRETMVGLGTVAKRLTVLDHHKTAAEALAGLETELREKTGRPHDVIFDMERSGAGITWDYLFGQEVSAFVAKRPWLVDYVEDRDLWRQALPQTKAVAAWVAAQPMDFASWDAMAGDGLEAAIKSGRAVEAYIAQYGRKALAEQTQQVLCGHTVPTVNLPYMNCSEHVGELLRQHPEAPFAAGYFRRGDGRWQFSLRSRPDFDVSVIAKQFGGGGHAGAAGFDVAILPWDLPWGV